MARYTIDFGDKLDQMLAELADEKGTTKAEVIRRAIATYRYLTKEVAGSNNTVKVSLSTNTDEVVKDVILP